MFAWPGAGAGWGLGAGAAISQRRFHSNWVRTLMAWTRDARIDSITGGTRVYIYTCTDARQLYGVRGAESAVPPTRVTAAAWRG